MLLDLPSWNSHKYLSEHAAWRFADFPIFHASLNIMYHITHNKGWQHAKHTTREIHTNPYLLLHTLCDNIGLVWWRMCMSRQCHHEELIHCATTSHALGHPCLVSLLFMSSSHFLIRRIIYLLVSFPFFTALTCIV